MRGGRESETGGRAGTPLLDRVLMVLLAATLAGEFVALPVRL